MYLENMQIALEMTKKVSPRNSHNIRNTRNNFYNELEKISVKVTNEYFLEILEDLGKAYKKRNFSLRNYFLKEKKKYKNILKKYSMELYQFSGENDSEYEVQLDEDNSDGDSDESYEYP